MKNSPPLSRRLALRLAAHARHVLPEHRADWAQAMNNELDHIGNDSAALRWAVGTVCASYLERLKSVEPGDVAVAARSILLSGALVVGGVAVIEASHILLQQLLMTDAIRLWSRLLPMSFLATEIGTAASIAFLGAVVSAPLIGVAWLQSRCLIVWVPSHARPIIRATILLDMGFVVGLATVGLHRLSGTITPELGPAWSIATVGVIVVLRILFIACAK